MKILWVSAAPWVRSAYGLQTDAITGHMSDDGHDVTIMAFAGLSGGQVQYGSRLVVPPAHKDLSNAIHYWALALRPDVIVTMLDMWTLEPFTPPDGIPWIAYVPIDTYPVSPRLLAKIEATPGCIPVSFSERGARECRAEGVSMRAIPFGVEPPPPRDRQAGLKTLGIQDAGSVVVGIIADNNTDPSRKALAEQIQAFGEEKTISHLNAVLYCHTSPYVDRGGLDLLAVARRAGLTCAWAGSPEAATADVLFAHPLRLSAGGYDGEYMSRAWDAIDVLLSASASEGFCIPVLEASVRGIPTVVTPFFGLPDIALNKRFVLGADDCHPVFRARTESNWMFPELSAVAGWLSEALAYAREQGRAAVPDEYLRKNTTMQVYLDYWRPLLAEIKP
jgi:hypothetical protein